MSYNIERLNVSAIALKRDSIRLMHGYQCFSNVSRKIEILEFCILLNVIHMFISRALAIGYRLFIELLIFFIRY